MRRAASGRAQRQQLLLGCSQARLEERAPLCWWWCGMLVLISPPRCSTCRSSPAIKHPAHTVPTPALLFPADHRSLWLTIASNANGKLTLTTPASSNLLPPGM